MIAYTTCDDNATTVVCDDATLVITALDVNRDYDDAPVPYCMAQSNY
jgi:hypothetical protein